MAYLLDVNVLIALFDTAHVHHDQAHEWFAANISQGWATCPMTENGVIRILSTPSYPNGPSPVSDLIDRMAGFIQTARHHVFWHDDISIRSISRSVNLTAATITDTYLLQLAASHAGSLATFDRRIAPALIGESDARLVEYL